MSQPLHQCRTKAVLGDGDQLRTGPKWMFSRRGILKLFEDHLTCGNWRIEYGDIREAVLTSFRTPILRLPGYVLAIRTDAATYHFGLNGWKYWQGELPFTVRREQGRLQLSIISILSRALVIGGLLYYLWEYLSKHR